MTNEPIEPTSEPGPGYGAAEPTSDDIDPTPRPRLSRRTGEELPPPEMRALARERSEARRVHDWAEADRLRAIIEAHGWKVVDKGAEGRVVRAHPEDVVEDDRVAQYGWTGAVPAYDGPHSSGTATIVARASHDPGDVVRLLSRLTDVPAGTHLLLVADESSVLPDAVPVAPGVPVAEVIRIAGAASAGVTLEIALRRARGEIIVVGEGWPAEASAERIPELAAALRDPAVGVAGWWGVASSDLRHFTPADAISGDPVAVAWAGLAFRTADGLERGPVDEQFRDPGMLATWWSLVLRDEGRDAAPRAARALLDSTGTDSSGTGVVGQDRDRAGRRDRYRIIDRFGQRYDLLTDPIAADRSRALHR